MKKYLTILPLLLLLIVCISAPAAAHSAGIAVNAGYWKGNNSFDVVVKEHPGDKLRLYVNDKSPVSATVNKQGWATFKKVTLRDNGKLSFTRVTGKAKERPINYTRQFNVDARNVVFKEYKPTPKPVAAPAPAPAPTPAPPPAPAPTSSNLSNDNTVHSPATTTDGSTPAGATAKCADGTYSFSQSRRGTCSHHGGVASWL